MGVFRPMTTILIAGLIITVLAVWGHHNRNSLKQTKEALTFVSEQMALLAKAHQDIQQALREEQAARARIEAEHRDTMARFRNSEDPEYRQWAQEPLPEAVTSEFLSEQERP